MFYKIETNINKSNQNASTVSGFEHFAKLILGLMICTIAYFTLKKFLLIHSGPIEEDKFIIYSHQKEKEIPHFELINK